MTFLDRCLFGIASEQYESLMIRIRGPIYNIGPVYFPCSFPYSTLHVAFSLSPASLCNQP